MSVLNSFFGRKVFFFLVIVIFTVAFVASHNAGSSLWFTYFSKLSFFNKTTRFIGYLSIASVIGLAGFAVVYKWRKIPFFFDVGTLWKLFGMGIVCAFLYSPAVYDFLYHAPSMAFFCIGVVLVSYAVLRRFVYIFLAPCLFVFLLQTVLFHYYGVRITPFLIQEALHGSKAEWGNMLSFGNVVVFLLLIGVVVITCLLINRILRNRNGWTMCSTACFFIALACISNVCIHPVKVHISTVWPVYNLSNLYSSFVNAQSQETRLLSTVAALKSPAEASSAINTVSPNSGVVLIVHIGESLKSGRMSINGWKHDTTPWLRNHEHVVNFPHCVSLSSSTCGAFVTILTDAKTDVQTAADGQGGPTVGSVLDLFSKHDFHLTYFAGARTISNHRAQKAITTKDFQTTFTWLAEKLTSSAENVLFATPRYHNQVEQIAHHCQENPDKNLLLFVNNIGSHGPFDEFDANTAPFKPFDVSSFYMGPSNSEVAEAVNNAYDNTVAYTDDFIRQVAESLKGRPFIYIYIGDHGEALGEDGVWTRAAMTDYYASDSCLVPWFFVYSPEFVNLHPHFAESIDNLRANSDKVVSHAHFFHSLLGLFGISSPYYDAHYDICSPAVSPYQGKMPSIRYKTNASLPQAVN